MKSWITWLVRSGCGLAVLLACASAQGAGLELQAIDGTMHKPLEIQKHAGAVLIFTLQDCPVANGYAPEIQRIHETYAKSNFAFYLVHVDPDLTAKDAKKHAADFGYTMPVLIDRKHELVSFAKATVTPQAIVISREGRILYRGRIDDRVADYGKKRPEPTTRDLRNALDSILAGKPVANPETKSIGCFIQPLEKK